MLNCLFSGLVIIDPFFFSRNLYWIILDFSVRHLLLVGLFSDNKWLSILSISNYIFYRVTVWFGVIILHGMENFQFLFSFKSCSFLRTVQVGHWAYNVFKISTSLLFVRCCLPLSIPAGSIIPAKQKRGQIYQQSSNNDTNSK